MIFAKDWSFPYNTIEDIATNPVVACIGHCNLASKQSIKYPTLDNFRLDIGYCRLNVWILVGD